MEIFPFDDFLTLVRIQSSLLDERRAMHCRKGEDIFRQGEICPDIFILTQGLVKLHYVTLDGKEWIKSFIMDEGMFGSLTSQSLGQPSTFSATCLEGSDVLPLPYRALRRVQAIPGWPPWFFAFSGGWA